MTETNSQERASGFASFMKDGFWDMMKGGVHTMLPGVIESFDNGTQRAKINLATATELKDGRTIQHPPMIEVPIQFFRFGGFSMTMPVKAGDEVAVFFSERGMDNFLSTGETGQPPTSARFFSLTDAFAIPGLNSDGNIVPAYNSQELEIKTDSGTCILKIGLTGDFTVTSDTTVLVEALLTATLKGTVSASLQGGTNTALINATGQFIVTNATGELNTITQSMLTILATLLTGAQLTTYNALLAQRATFL